jgi:hypothetical protein
MANYFGPEVKRHLSNEDRQFSDVLYLPKGPVLSEEFILGESISEEKRREILQKNVPSGWISNPSNPMEDFTFDRKNSNQFWFGKDGSEKGDIPHALVHGWMIPVAGTNNGQDFRNIIQLPPPQGSSSSSDVHFVFLEAWEARIPPGQDVTKPDSDKVYRFGNVEYGGTQLDDDMISPHLEKESTERTQIQYRLRVIEGVDPTDHPYGFDNAIKAQGPQPNPLSTSNTDYAFDNMGDEMDDPGLWRAGVPNTLNAKKDDVAHQSDLETVDGYVYAVPLCFVFRRTDGTWDITHQTHAYNRNPTMSVPSEAERLPTVSLDGSLSRAETSSFTVDTSQTSTVFNSGGGLMRIEDEIIEYTSYNGTTVNISSRGAKDTFITQHDDGAEVHHVSGHPEGLFSDQITEDDVYDLRHLTSFGDWDFDSLLDENFDALVKGDLQTQWKISRGDVKGTHHYEIDFFGTNPSNASYVEDRDKPDGFRKVFSDAATPQPNNLLVAAQDGVGGDGFGTTSTTTYDLNPSADLFKFNTSGTWEEGDSLSINLSQYRNTFDDVSRTEKVRFIHPSEYEDTSYDPMTISFANTYVHNTTSGLQDDLDARGSDPSFLVFGERPSDVSASYLSEDTTTIDYDDSPSPSTIDPTSVSFGDTPSSLGGSTEVGDYLANRNAWIICRGETANPGRNGAFKILGHDGTGGLEVEAADGTDPAFGGAGSPSGMEWFIRLESCTSQDEEVLIVLNSGLSGTPAGEFTDARLNLSYDLLYHPSRGLSRCPDDMLHLRMTTSNADSYLREDDLLNIRAQDEAKKIESAPMESYQHRRDDDPRQDIRDVAGSIQKIHAESYVDRGSKTLLFQPTRIVEPSLYAQQQQVSLSHDTLLNDAGFQGASTSDPLINVPGHLLPPPGRLDVPFVDTQTTSTNEPAWGLNSTILQDASSQNQEFVITNALCVYDSTNLSAGQYNSVVGLSTVGSGGPNRDAIVARYYDEGGVEGLEVSQHIGFSRLYGIYEQSDFYTNNINERGEFVGGVNNLYRQKDGSFNGTNLLRTDIEKGALHITDRDSFVIPRKVIDESTLSGSFENTAFILEGAIFAFNNWTSDRVQFHPLLSSSVSSGQLLENISFLTNAPADASASVQAVSARTPYQGNVSGTMPASTTSPSNTSYDDYRPKDQADTSVELNDLNTDLDIDDARVEHPARMEILSKKRFATSLGTGRVSGPVKHGSYTDIGYLDKNGFPDSSSVGNRRQVRSRGLVHSSSLDISRIKKDVYTGLSERLPIGMYASDHQLCGEPFYGQKQTFWTLSAKEGDGHTSYLDDGIPDDGQSMVFSDGTSGGSSSSLTYGPSNDLYRTYRGGTVMTEEGRPVTMSGERVYKEYPELQDATDEYLEALENNSFNPSSVDKQAIIDKHKKRMRIHGSVLFGVACLVRTQKEVSASTQVNNGQELQMLVITGVAFGQDDRNVSPLDGNLKREYLDLDLQLSPVGTGEGYCAADRYRIMGRPLRSPSREDEEDTHVDLHRFRD